MTNAGAMTALQTLKATNRSLEVTQGRISTGFRVSEAAHNAAYWSIATTMRSDNNAMSTVKDALGLGAAQVDIAYTAMDAVKDTIDEIKKKLVAASEPDVDKSKIQSEIEQLQNDLKTYAKSATFSGGNWLDVTGNSIEKVVASFIRTADGAIALGTIDVDTAKTALYNSGTTEGGLLQGTGNYRLNGLEAGAAAAADATGQATVSLGKLGTDAVTLHAGDTVSFDIDWGGVKSTITLTGTTGGVALSAATLNTAAGADWTVAADGDGNITIARATPAPADEGKTLTVSNLRATSTNALAVGSIDITNSSTDELASLLSGIEAAFNAVTTAASDLGAIKTRIASQQDFVSKIMDAVSRGVGQLVDADMEEESTRLQALQVQQQLGIQALSIANGNAQNILSLFRS
jgi:flagellin